jgi:hypothetical protein
MFVDQWGGGQFKVIPFGICYDIKCSGANVALITWQHSVISNGRSDETNPPIVLDSDKLYMTAFNSIVYRLPWFQRGAVCMSKPSKSQKLFGSSQNLRTSKPNIQSQIIPAKRQPVIEMGKICGKVKTIFVMSRWLTFGIRLTALTKHQSPVNNIHEPSYCMKLSPSKLIENPSNIRWATTESMIAAAHIPSTYVKSSAVLFFLLENRTQL